MPRKKPRNTARTNEKRTKLLKGIAQGMNVSEAGRKAGYKHYQSAHFALKGMRLQLLDVLERMDLPIEKVLRNVLLPGLEAKHTEFMSNGGIVIETKETVDHEQRGKFLDRYCKLLGLYGNGHDQEEDHRGPGSITLNVALLLSKETGDLIDEATHRKEVSQVPADKASH